MNGFEIINFCRGCFNFLIVRHLKYVILYTTFFFAVLTVPPNVHLVQSSRWVTVELQVGDFNSSATVAPVQRSKCAYQVFFGSTFTIGYQNRINSVSTKYKEYYHTIKWNKFRLNLFKLELLSVDSVFFQKKKYFCQ